MTGSSDRPRSTSPSPWPQCSSVAGTARRSSGSGAATTRGRAGPACVPAGRRGSGGCRARTRGDAYQLEDSREQLLGAEALVAVTCADQPAHQVVGWGGLLGLDEFCQHRRDRIGRLLGPCVVSGRRYGNKHPGEAPAQRDPDRPGHPEQLADDRERQRESEGGDEVDPAAGSLGGPGRTGPPWAP